MKERDVKELLIAVLSAASEQMDLDRLLMALHRQHDVYARQGAPAVAGALRDIGKALTAISRVREKKRGPLQ